MGSDKDIEVASDGTIYLRAERSGSGPGRTYTITYRAIDASGNWAMPWRRCSWPTTPAENGLRTGAEGAR